MVLSPADVCCLLPFKCLRHGAEPDFQKESISSGGVPKFFSEISSKWVQIFQRGTKFFSKISSGGSLFITKFVLGGTNLGGSTFTMTGSWHSCLLRNTLTPGTVNRNRTSSTNDFTIVSKQITVNLHTMY